MFRTVPLMRGRRQFTRDGAGLVNARRRGFEQVRQVGDIAVEVGVRSNKHFDEVRRGHRARTLRSFLGRRNSTL